MKSLNCFLGLVLCTAHIACAWTHAPATKELGVNGGSFTLTVSGTEYYDWYAGSDVEWITVTRVNAKTFSVVVKANDTSDERWAYVTINAFQGGTTPSAQTRVNFQHCSVTQAGQNKPSVDPVAISFPKAGGVVTIDVTAASGDSWKVVESLSWLTASATSGKGDGRVTLTASENPSCLPRAGTLTIAGKEITVKQAGEPGYSRIVYGNLRGAENPNPDYYKEGEKFVLMPLRDIDGYKFAGWKPAMIEASQTGEVEVVANWRSTNYCEIVDVVARQRYPWNGMVDIAVKIIGESNDVARADCIFAATNVATCVGLPVTHVTRAGDDVGSGSVWMRRFVWDAAADVGEVKIDDVALTVVVKGVEQGGVQLWKGGPYWSECNVGATKPEQYGYYFWWGDTVGYKWSGGTLDSDSDYANVTWQTSKGEYADSPFAKLQCPTYEKSNSALQSAGYIDSTGNLVADHDAATAHLGLPWRMPTHDDFDGLANRCDAVWTNTNGVYGCLVKGRGEYASKSIFLPAGGFGRDGLHYVFQPGVLSSGIYHGACFYWSSTRYSEYNAYDSCSMDSCYDYCHDPRWAHTSGINAGGQTERNYGMTVRPLRDFVDPPSVAMASLSLDCRVGVRVADAMEAICFSPVWETLEDGAVATVMVNDTQVTNAIDAGEFEWTPLQDGTFVLSHIVSVNGLPVGETLHATFIVEGAPIPATPVISPTSLTTFESPLTITITCVTKGAKIYYTLNGADPTEQSSRYDGGFVVSTKGGVTIKTVAISPTGERSEVATFEIPAPNPPTISPASGTIIGSSVSVNIASDNPNATIYCTTDGTEPTTDSPVYSRFKASKKMTVKAIAVVDGMAWSETATAEYALGQCVNPTIIPAEGTVFVNSNYQVSIAKNGEKGVLRYTTDGSDPTETSSVYSGPFTISETTTIKAKTFDTDYFDSAVVAATLTRQWTKVATPVIVAPERFSGTKAAVSLTCATEGAVIRYTTDGSVPNSHSPKYTGAFEVTGTTTVKAIALKTDCATSDVATLTIAKEWCIGDALNDPDRQFVTDSGTGWVRDTKASHDGTESMRSGAIVDSVAMGVYSTSTLSTVVEGKGSVRFLWMASCEEDDEFEWDHGEFRVDGVVVAQINLYSSVEAG